MVLLVVKGTKFPDEFIYQCDASTPVNPPPAAAEANAGETLTRAACQSASHLINARHQLKMALLSAQELATEKRAATTSTEAAEADETSKALNEYEALVDGAFANLKDTTTPITNDTVYDGILADLRARTTALFPTYCTHADGTDAAIQVLYQQHDENPDLPEDVRLVMYHCRAIIDPKWNAREQLDETDAGLWFCGKLMDKPTLRDYCGRNEKSKLMVKVASRKGPAPSGEPRMRYEDQRALFEHMRAKRAELGTLEESELRERVLLQSRGAVRMPVSGGGAGRTDGSLASLQTGNLRPIYSNKQERVIGEN